MLKLILADESLLNDIKALYFEAFPAYERKPFDIILQKSDEGTMRIYAIMADDLFVGEAIFILHGDIALLDYFAIAPELRGKGYGTEAIKLICEHFADKKLLLEIEDPNPEEDCGNREQRVRRLEFYRSCGLEPMNYLVCLYGVDMRILTYRCDVRFEEYHDIFVHVFGKRSADNMKFVKFLD